MGKALYRKYRSKKLSEVVGQEHITTTLEHALKKGKISHAYLFTGPRGVGKTSIARILAHAVNQLEYSEETTHLDIIEIDAASNRRIDEIRELRERVHTAPTSAKYKVYIIDEVHMLTKEAFNALLKTLEEPPAHVIFILATTESHKLPETIISRTQRFAFKAVSGQAMIDHLRYIADKEKITIDDAALALIAEHGSGSFRDSISLLDQVSNTAQAIGVSQVRTTLGIAPEEALEQLTHAVLRSQDAGAIITLLQQLRDSGYQSGQIARQLARYIRFHMLDDNLSSVRSQLLLLLKALLEVPTSHDVDTGLDLVLLDANNQSSPTPQTTITDIVEATTPTLKPSKPTATPLVEKKPITNPTPEEPVQVTKDESPKQAITGSGTLNDALWQSVLASIKTTHNTLYSVARMAVPTFSDGELTLALAFPFHQKRLSESRNRQVLVDSIYKLSGQNVSITCVVSADAAPPKPKPKVASASSITPSSPDSLETISNIFGPSEMLES